MSADRVARGDVERWYELETAGGSYNEKVRRLCRSWLALHDALRKIAAGHEQSEPMSRRTMQRTARTALGGGGGEVEEE